MTIDNRLGQTQPRDKLGRGVHGRQLRHPLIECGSQSGIVEITRDPAIGVTRKIEAEIERNPQLQISDIDAGLA